MRKINESIGLNQTHVSLNDRFISAVGYNPEKPIPKVPADLPGNEGLSNFIAEYLVTFKMSNR